MGDCDWAGIIFLQNCTKFVDFCDVKYFLFEVQEKKKLSEIRVAVLTSW